MRVTVDRKGNIYLPDFLNLEKWSEIRKKNKIKVMAWETVKLTIPLAFAIYAAFIIDVKEHPEMEFEHIFKSVLIGIFLAFAFVFTIWCCMEKNWLYMQNKLQEKFSEEVGPNVSR